MTLIDSCNERNIVSAAGVNMRQFAGQFALLDAPSGARAVAPT